MIGFAEEIVSRVSRSWLDLTRKHECDTFLLREAIQNFASTGVDGPPYRRAILILSVILKIASLSVTFIKPPFSRKPQILSGSICL